MDSPMQYTVTDSFRQLPVADYITRFRDAERIEGYCRECHNYGRAWCCPPFDTDPATLMAPYRNITLIVTRITPRVQGLPFTQTTRLLLPERLRIERQLKEWEQRYGGRAFSYTGSCLHCHRQSCTRPEGKPCRHPEKVRPSLEACGFDVCKTTAELFDTPILWGRDGQMPEYLLLVSGFLHNNDTLPCDNE